MNVKNMYAFYLSDSKKSLAVFYGIVVAVYMLFAITVISANGEDTINGMEISSLIFIFILGLNLFKSNFQFGLTNGVSRRTQFISFTAAAATLGVFMAAMDVIIEKLVNIFFSSSSLYLGIYGGRYSSFSAGLTLMDHIQMIAEQFLWCAFLYAAMAMLGFCINLIYYRSNTIMKYIVSVIPFIVVFVVEPYIERTTNGAFLHSISDFLSRAMGIGLTINPYIAMLSFFIGFGVLALCSYLLMRHAVIKQ